MNTFNTTELQEGVFFSKDVFLDKKFILLTPATAVSLEFIRELKEWEFLKIYSEGEQTETSVISSAQSEDEDKDRQQSSSDAESGGDASRDSSQTDTDDSIYAQVERTYLGFQNFIAEVYTQYVTKKELQLQAISDKVKELCEFIKEYRKYVLRIQPSQENRDKNYLVVHSMRSTVFAIVIGQQLKFPIHKLIELGVSTILHEIGMVRLPPQVYMGKKELTPIEKNAILTHPVISYNILREFSFPLNICLGVLEHHERENGEGYPRKLAKDKISIYAKIIAVACSYEAMTANRPFKEARDAFTGIIDLMKNPGKQYDDMVIRALLFSLSLYPIGIYVLLSNDKKAQVIDVNPDNPKYPIVQIVGETKPDGTPKIVETSEYGLSVKRPLSREETKALSEASS
ncbi:MAG: HD-GYP domain-containing protein [Treponema sp.]|nr:MAG: Cyclic di-GMP phosphodiesterase response regulator RpfG [Spirochaetes bacterium ADurb.Bin269]TAH55365.1 MAG: HD-GYP domain-containing protein [Treponema sp.]